MPLLPKRFSKEFGSMSLSNNSKKSKGFGRLGSFYQVFKIRKLHFSQHILEFNFFTNSSQPYQLARFYWNFKLEVFLTK